MVTTIILLIDRTESSFIRASVSSAVRLCHNLGIVLDYSEELLQRGGSLTLHAHTKGKWAKCPYCGRRTKTVHRHIPRKLQCTELLGHNVVLILKSRHMTGNQIR